jgi:hypothetical protein
MNWKSLVEKTNQKVYVLPPGWDSRDDIAEQLECSPEKVDENLRPLLRSGEVVKDTFTVWDKRGKRPIRVIAYQKVGKDAEASTAGSGATFDVKAVAKMKSGGLDWNAIGAKFGLSGPSVRSRYRRAVAK